MVTYTQAQVADKAAFPSAGNFKNVEPYLQPDPNDGYILPLTNDRGRELAAIGWEIFRGVRGWCVNAEKYALVSEKSLYGWGPAEDNNDYRVGYDWLLTLGIDDKVEVYVAFEQTAMVTQWGVFCQYWDDFWGPFSYVNVFDDTLAWGVLIGPEEWAVFVGQTNEPRLAGKGNIGCGLGNGMGDADEAGRWPNQLGFSGVRI